MAYDLILSLGGSCAVANQLKTRGLRLFSLPFDWLYCTSPKTLEALSVAFKDDFSMWMLDENLVELPQEAYDKASAKFQYEDQLTGYRFIHDFRDSKEKILTDVREKYEYRIKRLYEKLTEASSIALCFDSNFGNCQEALLALRDVLLKKFGETKKIDCYWVEFQAECHCVETPVEGFFHYSFTHPKTDYIFGVHPTFEFEFMDAFQLTNKFKSEERGKGRIFYLARTHKGIKLWLWRFSRSLFSFTVTIGKRAYEIRIGR